jgi:hypothetical protein
MDYDNGFVISLPVGKGQVVVVLACYHTQKSRVLLAS